MIQVFIAIAIKAFGANKTLYMRYCCKLVLKTVGMLAVASSNQQENYYPNIVYEYKFTIKISLNLNFTYTFTVKTKTNRFYA